MPLMKFLNCGTLCLTLLLISDSIFCSVVEESGLAYHHSSRVSMASTYSLDIYGPDEKELPLIAEAAFDEVDRIDQLMSIYKTGSPVSIFNRNASSQPVPVETELFKFFQTCLKYSNESGGAFDITIQPLMKLWGFYGGQRKIPQQQQIRHILQRVGYEKLVLDPNFQTVYFQETGMAVDLGGIGKGYAVDRVVALLKENQIRRALINAGGSTLFALGAPPGQKAWSIKIRDPRLTHNSEQSPVTVQLRNQCLSISGNYEQVLIVEGNRYSHIMDPREGYPIRDVLSVAVITSSGVKGDVMDNILFVKGVHKSNQFLKEHPDVKAYFFLPNSEKGWKMIVLPSDSR